MTLTHSTVLLFRVRWESLHLSCCFCVFSSSSSSSLVFRQGPHFRMMFFSLRFSPLLLVVDVGEFKFLKRNPFSYLLSGVVSGQVSLPEH